MLELLKTSGPLLDFMVGQEEGGRRGGCWSF